MKDKKKNKRIKLAFLCLVVLLLGGFALWVGFENKNLELNEYKLVSNRIPKAFSGFKIAQVSDLHNDEMGSNNEKLINMLKDVEPDLIAVTGDLIDSRTPDVKVALDFIGEAVKIAPTYYVSGNHEQRVPADYEALRAGLEQAGVNVLDNEKIKVEQNGACITVAGVTDPSFEDDILLANREIMGSQLSSIMAEDNGYTLLLSHRPELFDVYTEYGADVVLTGHAHGGQFRLPFVGGLYAPDQGLFPEYEAGLYSDENTTMIVSRGVGNSLFPFRLFNRPEVVVVELISDN